MRMVTLILLSDASSLALEQPSSMVLRMSGPRRRIFRDGLPLSYNCTICRLNASS